MNTQNFKQRFRFTLKAIDAKLGIRKWLWSDNLKDRPGAFLAGDRGIEWAWVVSHLPPCKAEILDIGGNYSPLGTIAAMLGHQVTIIDMNPLPFAFSGVKVMVGDFLKAVFRKQKFDCIIVCSTIEHFGLAWRYGSSNDPEGDLRGMVHIQKLLKPNGTVLLTIPVGVDACLCPWHRIYGRIRLPALLNGFRIVKECYYAKSDRKIWREVDKEAALSFEGSVAIYALGLFVLNVTGAKKHI